MKILLAILGIILLFFVIVQIYTMSVQNNIETYSYSVETVYDKFEIRKYEASLFTSGKMSSNKYDEVSSQGFGILAGYIFGGNSKNQQIAMTSPVSVSLSDSMTMMFMVPKSIKKEDLPAPDQEGIEFKEEPSKRVAAISFGGWANNLKIEQYKNQLMALLDQENISYSNRFFFLGYNAPYEMVGRKNEIIVEID